MEKPANQTGRRATTSWAMGLRRAALDWGLRAAVAIGVLLSTPPSVHAQNPATDRLRAKVQANIQPDASRVNSLNALALELRNNAPDESASLFEEARQLAQLLGYTAGAAEAELGLGFYHRHRSEFPLAESFSEQARRDFERVGDRIGQTRSLYNQSNVYSEQGLYAKSLQANLRGLALAEAVHSPKWLAFLNTQLGITSTYLSEYENARRYLMQGLRWARRSGDQPGIGHAYSGLGNLYRTQGQWATAQYNYEQDAKIFRQLKDEGGLLFEGINVADMEERQGHYPEAFANARRSLRLALRLRAVGEVPRAELVLARTFLHIGRPDSAIFYALRTLQATRRSGARQYSRDASQILAQASARRGNFAAAYRYEKLFGAYRDTLNSSDLQRQAAVLEYRAELAKKQAQIGRLTSNSWLIQSQNRQQGWLLLAALLGLGAVGTLSAVLWRNNREKQRAYALLKHQQDELHAAQSQLVAAEKWAFVGELSAGIAHELQNPLAFMKNFADVSVGLLDHSPAAQPAGLEQEIMAGLKQNLLKISQQGQRASAIITDMLAHARTGAGPRVPTELNALVAEALALAYQGLRVQDATFHATLVQDFTPNLGLVAVVPSDLTRVLVNLCTNALHAVRQQAEAAEVAYQPTVTVGTRQTAAGTVEITVHDNGTGMPAQVREKIFQPFFTTKPMGEGTGLGLSLSHEIVTKGHGGTLAVESEEGKGTEFIISLPTGGKA
ncbi:tetratricopeptide repeat-containing sensor histidine kinase [Hymenobacter siberiensis]|uniref:tetratricopeptide repeat-containing sensor histidine kinase n=1 Tax=Hymenobacter siberiensis TaxID=2848396 RepID=UPI001C1E06D0|nr:tetratricopeptide repeat-containing sensor histidine kinase [Hymenobacter siberiensis]MBU6120197.1 tetratricopeptide repeat-containing sensor histidine kinase [Hymenobacter siberiensis]